VSPIDTVPAGFSLEAPAALATYVQIVAVVNGSGDLDICENCLATDQSSHAGVAWDFTNISVEYQIVGCQ